ncbi:MAG TPA: hypothetical protein VG672_21770, partial [Bryobacteraceae bacterium]|nr:hypothetical protein [Bryobacteraceae bacterium]
TGIVGAAIGELRALEHPPTIAALLVVLAAVALFSVLSNNRQPQAEIRFEEEPPDKLLTLDLS